MLKSRTKYTSESFVSDFLDTLKAGVIKRENFIDWNLIKSKLINYQFEIDFFESILTKNNKLDEIKNSILSADEPKKYVEFIFNLLGHTPKHFVTWEDKIKIVDVITAFKEGDEIKINSFFDMLKSVGFEEVLSFEKIKEIYFGILIGL